MQQRVRVAVQAFGRDVLMAGAGPASTALAGPLVLRLPPVAPYRRGQHRRRARRRLLPRRHRQRDLRASHPRRGRHRAERRYRPRAARGRRARTAAPSCTSACAASLVGMRVVLFDAHGAFDLGTVTSVAGDQVRVLHGGALSSSYNGGAVMAEAVAFTYFLRPDPRHRRIAARALRRLPDRSTGRGQCRRHGTWSTSAIRGRRACCPRPAPGDPMRPITSYGPAPPRLRRRRSARPLGTGRELRVRRRRWAGASPRRARARASRRCRSTRRSCATDPGAPMRCTRRGSTPICCASGAYGCGCACRWPSRRCAGRPAGSSPAAARRSSAELFAPDQQIVLDVTPRNLGGAP